MNTVADQQIADRGTTNARAVHSWRVAALWAALALTACRPEQAPLSDHAGTPASIDASHVSAIEDSVRLFAAEVARGVSERGPAAWRGYFIDGPSFFMATEGRLMFPTGDSARRAIDNLTRIIPHIELRWGDTVRVDALAPGLAMMGAAYQEVRVDSAGRRDHEAGFFTGVVEHRVGGWQFRDAHWSVVTPPPAVP